MAHHTEQVGFPSVPLNGGMKLRLRMISPTTGLDITGVSVSEWAIYGLDTSDAALEDVVPLYSLDSDEDSGTV